MLSIRTIIAACTAATACATWAGVAPPIFANGFESPNQAIDASTVDGKVMFGYQGWFACPGELDGDAWWHWSAEPANPVLDASNLSAPMFPDNRELTPSERCATNLELPGGAPAFVYTAANPDLTTRHMRWLYDYGVDGVFLQRFLVDLADPRYLTFRNDVLDAIRIGAEAEGRVFSVMYDVTGADPATLVDALLDDWRFLVEEARITDSPAYVRHNGLPVVVVWGLGFADRPGTPADAAAIIAGLTDDFTVMGGVPTGWRDLSDERTDPAWAAVYRSFDIISPWSVGRFGSDQEADDFRRNFLEPDLADTASNNLDYMPVLWPGFVDVQPSIPAAINEIKRDGGRFFWRQLFNAVDAGANMLYLAMFDEIDEGTAMYKLAPDQDNVPVGLPYTPVTLDADGETLPSDWYLLLSGDAAATLRGEMTPQPELPRNP